MTETAKTWHKRVARWKASGETAAAFGAREGVRANTLLWWSSKLKREAAESSAPVRMVQLVRTPSSSRGSGVIVELSDVRARVMVEPGFDRETLGVVLEMLRLERA